MEKSKKVNVVTRPVPSGPGAEQITYQGQQAMKGGSEMNSKLPEKYMIPGDSKAKTTPGK